MRILLSCLVLSFSSVVMGGDYDWPSHYDWPVDNRPVVEFVWDDSCVHCPPAKKALTPEVRDKLPFRIEDKKASDIEWDDKIPAFTWTVKGKRKVLYGFPGIESLIQAWKGTQGEETYPTRRYNWTGPVGDRKSAIQHLLNDGIHRGRFSRRQLESLTLDQLQALHSDDHEGRVKWNALAN